MSEWLQNLKPGDKVVVGVGNGSYSRIEAVDRVTATQIIIGGARYRKNNGYRVGDGWNSGSLKEPTKAMLDEIELRSLRSKASSVLDEIARNIPKTIKQVKALIAAVEPFRKKPEGK